MTVSSGARAAALRRCHRCGLQSVPSVVYSLYWRKTTRTWTGTPREMAARRGVASDTVWRSISRRRDCHFADTPFPSTLTHLLKGQGRRGGGGGGGGGGGSRMTASPTATLDVSLRSAGRLRHPPPAHPGQPRAGCRTAARLGHANAVVLLHPLRSYSRFVYVQAFQWGWRAEAAGCQL